MFSQISKILPSSHSCSTANDVYTSSVFCDLT
jgi:hypothetical protein